MHVSTREIRKKCKTLQNEQLFDTVNRDTATQRNRMYNNYRVRAIILPLVWRVINDAVQWPVGVSRLIISLI